jgi:prepilin peptidase CpaA
MTQSIQWLVLALFGGLMTAAAFEDFRRYIIPNRLTAALCLLWPAYFATAPSLWGALAAVGCGLAVFAVGALLFARGYVGGGDVKLLAAAALWAGPSATAALLIVTALLGGVLALAVWSPIGAHVIGVARGMFGPPAPEPPTGSSSAPVPYGVAIAGAALIVVLTPHLG